MARRFKERYKGTLFESKNVCNKEVSISECVANQQNTTEFTIEIFIKCKNNLANNRHTRLLAYYDQNNTDCNVFKIENRRQLLESAKNVLSKTSFFAITEYELLSQRLFEKTFENSFRFNYTVNPKRVQTESFRTLKKFNNSIVNMIKDVNDLDLELYEFAKILFFKRLKFYGIETTI